MHTYKSLMFISGVLTLLTACASGDLRVTSTPDGAEVYMAYDGEQPEKIGTTPLRLDEKIGRSTRGKYARIEVRKDGFKPESVLVPLNAMPKTIEISARLEATKLPDMCSNQTAAVEKISRGIADSQSLLKSGNRNAAQARLNNLITEYPGVTVLHDLLGNVHYINKNLDAALTSYQRSLDLDPTNSDTQRMVTKIREILGRRSPASDSKEGR